MSAAPGTTAVRVLHALQKRMVWLLLATYGLGAAFPTFGLRLRDIKLAAFPLPRGQAITVSLPMMMLGLLLIVAGLGAHWGELKKTLQRPWLVVSGVTANAAFPVLYAVVVSLLLKLWHNPDEAENILVGLALIGAMPIAGASTAWSQNADGNLALSLGLVISSTALSPLLTPLGLHAVGMLTHGDYSEDLHELASQGSSGFVLMAVVIPSLIGIALHALVGNERAKRVMPTLKAFNLANLLLLNYSNAAVALPQILKNPDFDFLALILLLAGAMCVGAFLLGWELARRLRADRRDQTSLMFGLGMNNNGAGLVLASAALADHPLVLLPIILYNLVQQIVAGVVDFQRRRALARAV